MVPVVLIPVAAISIGFTGLPVFASAAIWLGAIFAFLVVAGYRWDVCMALLHYFLPPARRKILAADAPNDPEAVAVASLVAEGSGPNR